MILFLDSFLTDYFIKTSQESIVNLSMYYAIGSFIAASIIKNKFKIGMFRIVGFLMLLFAGISGNQLILNIVMVLLTLSILVMGINIRKIEKFDK